MAENNGSRLDNELVSFREHWQEELKTEREVEEKEVHCQNEEEGGALTVEERATQLFLEGARYEKHGQFNIAVYYYRQAVHLVPDIEFKIAELKQPGSGLNSNDISEDDDEIEHQHYEGNENMSQVDSVTNSFGLMKIAGLCSPSAPQTATHISALPTELLSLLFRWVVSKDLDVKSLSRLSLVCKWFYVCARDEEIWKQICLRVWGISCDIGLYNNCWRRMFLEKPHVKLDGVYISANSYIHLGQPSVGSYYKACHLVEYYKYLRFFSDGTVLVYTSAEEPQSVVQLLNHPPYRDPSVHKGYYRLSGSDQVNVFYTRVIKPRKDYSRRRNREKPEICEHHFFMTLTLKSSARRRNCQLLWDMYMYQIKNRKSGESSENEIAFSSFKPFVFSGVRSYLSQSVNSI